MGDIQKHIEKAMLYDEAYWFNLLSDSVINFDCPIAEWTSINKRRVCSLADMSRIFTSKCIKKFLNNEEFIKDILYIHILVCVKMIF